MQTNKNILLTAFHNSSAECMIRNIERYRILLLPNDKCKDSEKLIDVISSEKFEYVISFGQRPNIKNKVHIETTAIEGELHIGTNFDCDKLDTKMVFVHIPFRKNITNFGEFCKQILGVIEDIEYSDF